MPRKQKSESDILLEAEIPGLRRYARNLTRDVSRADDLVQSCLARAVAKQHLWEPGTDLRAWLFTIMHNQHVNEIRRSVREGVSVQVEDMSSFLIAQPRAGSRLELRDLERALAKLPEEQRQVILLVALEGMRYEEVADILQVPVGTVRSRLSRGRDALRLLMEDRPLSSAQQAHVAAFDRRRMDTFRLQPVNGDARVNGHAPALRPIPPPMRVAQPIRPALTPGHVRERVVSIAKRIEAPQTAPVPALEVLPPTPVAPPPYVSRTELVRRREVLLAGHRISVSVIQYR